MDEKKLTKEEVSAIVIEFIDSIDYAIDFTVEEDEAEHVFKVQMTGENLGALIGFHGKNIGSIEHIMNLMMLRKYTAPLNHIRLDINEYRQNRYVTIIGFLENSITQVRRTHKNFSLNPMTPGERKVVHEYLKDYNDVESRSEGEEPNRFITLYYTGDKTEELEELS